jgi:hypothetical protein
MVMQGAVELRAMPDNDLLQAHVFGGKPKKSFGGDQKFRGRAKCFAGVQVYFGESVISPKHTKTDWHLCMSREHVKIAIYFAKSTNVSGNNKSAL